MLPFVYHPGYMAQLRPGHRFPMSKYGYLRDRLIALGLMPAQAGFFAPAPADLTMVARVHEIGYVERVFDARMRAEETRRIGLPSTEAVAMRARLSVSGTTLAARLALEHGFACNMAGGSHHAGPEFGAGFCVFNDVAVAAAALLAEGVVRSVAVIDLDVHQGDGTADIFKNDPRVFTLSVHAQNNYPQEKAVSDLDIGLPDGLGDTDYLKVIAETLPKIIAQKPDIVFYNAGVDPYEGDRLGRLKLSLSGLRARDRAILSACQKAGLPCVGVLGGGYSADPLELAVRHAILFEETARMLQGGTDAA